MSEAPDAQDEELDAHGLPTKAVPNLHFFDLRLRFKDGRAFVEDIETGQIGAFPLGIEPNYVCRGVEDGKEYVVPLEGQRIILTVSVIDVDLAMVTGGIEGGSESQ